MGKVLNGGNFKLTGGFWFETPPGDCNANGAVALLDYEDFISCILGPAAGTDLGSECFNANVGGTIDLADFAEFQNNFTAE